MRSPRGSIDYVWDVVQPKNRWERDYAYIEWLRVGLYRMFAHNIPVLDANGCRIINGELYHDDFCSDVDNG